MCYSWNNPPRLDPPAAKAGAKTKLKQEPLTAIKGGILWQGQKSLFFGIGEHGVQEGGGFFFGVDVLEN